jgi:hypothetical protein
VSEDDLPEFTAFARTDGGCLLCGDRDARIVGIFIPALAPDCPVAYRLCDACAQEPDSQARVEDELVRRHRVPGRASSGCVVTAAMPLGPDGPPPRLAPLYAEGRLAVCPPVGSGTPIPGCELRTCRLCGAPTWISPDLIALHRRLGAADGENTPPRKYATKRH